MTDKELKKLRRRDLLELLINQTESNEQLQTQYDTMNVKLQSREIPLAEAGSLAEAVAQVSEVFRKADQIAEQYLENSRRLTERQQETCEQMERECREHCEKIVAEAEVQCEQKKQEAEEFWLDLSTKLEHFYQEHLKIQSLISGNTALIPAGKEAGTSE